MWVHPTEPSVPWIPRPLSQVDEFSIHHSVSENREWSEEEEQEHIFSIYAQHRAVGRFAPQWSAPGIGYNWLGFPSGRVYYVGAVNVERAAVANQNQHIVACCLVGNFTEQHPTDAVLQAVRLLHDNAWPETTVRPHRFYNRPGWSGNTACPGNTYAQWIGAISGV